MTPSAGEKKYDGSAYIGLTGSRKKCCSDSQRHGWPRTRLTSVSSHSHTVFAMSGTLLTGRLSNPARDGPPRREQPTLRGPTLLILGVMKPDLINYPAPRARSTSPRHPARL